MLRVLTYNVRRGGGGRLAAILGVIRAQAPDAVALIEAPGARGLNRLAGELGMQSALAEAASGFHVAWLSRLPMERAESHQYMNGDQPMLEIQVAVDGQAVRLFAVHLRAGRSERQERRRTQAVCAILDRLPRVSGEPHLLVGDFNALHSLDRSGAHSRVRGLMRGLVGADRIRRHAIQQLLEAGYTDGYRALHPSVQSAPGFTYPVPHPWLRFDYIFASAQLARRLIACEAIEGGRTAAASDHYPVVAEFL
jgi:exodeoxyribonuclease-3